MSWRAIFILLLIVGAVLSGWAVLKHRRPDAVVKAADNRPDYVLHDFEMTALDGEGKESFTLQAPKLERHPGDKTMALSTPLFLLPNGEGRHWEVRSQTAWVSANHEEIRLSGQVKANSPAEELRPITMNTERLNVFPQQNRATSDDMVTIVQPGSILSGRGFAVSTTSKHYELRSEVKARYAPRR